MRCATKLQKEKEWNWLAASSSLNPLIQNFNIWVHGAFWSNIYHVNTISEPKINNLYRNIFKRVKSSINCQLEAIMCSLICSFVIYQSIGCSGTQTHNYLVPKQILNHLVKLTKWLSCVVRTFLYGALAVCLHHVIYAFRVNLLSLIATMLKQTWYWKY